MRKSVLLVIFLTFINTAVAQSTKNDTAARIFKSVSPSVVTIQTKNEEKSQGSGVVVKSFEHPPIGPENITQTSYIVTNAHVVNNTDAVIVVSGNTTYDGVINGIDTALDLALITVHAKLPSASIHNQAKKLTIGESVYAIGTPLGLDRTITTGIISGFRNDEIRDLIQTSTPISPGSSGGGLFSSEGRLIGITTEKMPSGEALGFAVPTQYIETLLDTVNAQDYLRMNLSKNIARHAGASPSMISYLEKSKELPRWLRERNIEGERAYQRVMRLGEIISKSMFDQEKYAQLVNSPELLGLIEIGNLFMKETNPSSLQGDIINLACRVRSPGGNIDNIDFVIDLTNQTINGQFVLIQEDAFVTAFGNKGDSHIIINRQDGSLFISKLNIHGKCTLQKPRKKAF